MPTKLIIQEVISEGNTIGIKCGFEDVEEVEKVVLKNEIFEIPESEMTNHDRINKKLLSGQPVYLIDDFEGLVVKYDKGQHWLKFKGEEPRPVSHSSKYVMEAYCAGKEITKNEYDEY